MNDDRQRAFDQFWKVWPKRVARKDAERAWSRIAPEKYPAVVAAVERQKKLPAWQKDAGAYIPYPATWLRGERWNDEIVLPEDDDAAILIEALFGHAVMPNDLPAKIAQRFRAMCARLRNTCMAPHNWPEYHLALSSGRITAEAVRTEYLKT